MIKLNLNKMENTVQQRITPFLWFNGRVEEAVNFYTTVFKEAAIISQSYLPAEAPGKPGKMQTATIKLNGLEFYLLDGGPMFQFNPAVSFFVHCNTQEEVDYYWERLSEGSATNRCGWLTDKFGLSWQVVPDALAKLMGDPDRKKAAAVMKAMMQMTKIDISALESAYQNGN